MDQFLLIFVSGSFTGWILERVHYALRSQPLRHGLMSGPYLPIYGIMSIILLALWQSPLDLFVKVVLIALVPTALELFAGIVLLSMFGIRLWNYFDCLLNFRGIICLQYSVLWAGLSLLFCFGFLPLFTLLEWEVVSLRIFLGVYFIFFIFDLFFALRNLIIIRHYRCKQKLCEIDYRWLKTQLLSSQKGIFSASLRIFDLAAFTENVLQKFCRRH